MAYMEVHGLKRARHADLVTRIEADADETRHVTLKAQTPLGEELLQ